MSLLSWFAPRARLELLQGMVSKLGLRYVRFCFFNDSSDPFDVTNISVSWKKSCYANEKTRLVPLYLFNTVEQLIDKWNVELSSGNCENRSKHVGPHECIALFSIDFYPTITIEDVVVEASNGKTYRFFLNDDNKFVLRRWWHDALFM